MSLASWIHSPGLWNHLLFYHLFMLKSRNRKANPCEVGFFVVLIGAGEMNRTPDLLITNELLYRLSYTGFPDQNSSMGF
jgi:hypothetical protein